jgi:hypothetical protein
MNGLLHPQLVEHRIEKFLVIFERNLELMMMLCPRDLPEKFPVPFLQDFRHEFSFFGIEYELHSNPLSRPRAAH